MSERVSLSSIIENRRNRERRINGPPTTEHGLCHDDWSTADRRSLSQSNVWTRSNQTLEHQRTDPMRFFANPQRILHEIRIDGASEYFSSDIFPEGVDALSGQVLVLMGICRRRASAAQRGFLFVESPSDRMTKTSAAISFEDTPSVVDRFLKCLRRTNMDVDSSNVQKNSIKHGLTRVYLHSNARRL